MSSDSLTHIYKQPCGFHCSKQNYTHAHTHYCCCCGVLRRRESQRSVSATVHCNMAACAFKFHDPLFTAGAGWQGELVHAALNNWDCKVNVRRIVKDGSFPLATQLVWFSQLTAHQQFSHQHSQWIGEKWHEMTWNWQVQGRASYCCGVDPLASYLLMWNISCLPSPSSFLSLYNLCFTLSPLFSSSLCFFSPVTVVIHHTFTSERPNKKERKQNENWRRYAVY